MSCVIRLMQEVLAAVRDAAKRAETVILSIHSHEDGETSDQPPAHLRAFCRAGIAAGATIVAVHGAHSVRGAEIIDGAPVFYGLGNFIAQNELVDRLPAQSYEFFGVDLAGTPTDVYDARTSNDTKGFPTLRRCWESVVPVCTFDEGRLIGIDVYPISLGFGLPRSRRGRPAIAGTEIGADILDRFISLSNDLAPAFTRAAADHGPAAVLKAE